MRENKRVIRQGKEAAYKEATKPIDILFLILAVAFFINLFLLTTFLSFRESYPWGAIAIALSCMYGIFFLKFYWKASSYIEKMDGKPFTSAKRSLIMVLLFPLITFLAFIPINEGVGAAVTYIWGKSITTEVSGIKFRRSGSRDFCETLVRLNLEGNYFSNYHVICLAEEDFNKYKSQQKLYLNAKKSFFGTLFLDYGLEKQK